MLRPILTNTFRDGDRTSPNRKEVPEQSRSKYDTGSDKGKAVQRPVRIRYVQKTLRVETCEDLSCVVCTRYSTTIVDDGNLTRRCYDGAG